MVHSYNSYPPIRLFDWLPGPLVILLVYLKNYYKTIVVAYIIDIKKYKTYSIGPLNSLPRSVWDVSFFGR